MTSVTSLHVDSSGFILIKRNSRVTMYRLSYCETPETYNRLDVLIEQ